DGECCGLDGFAGGEPGREIESEPLRLVDPLGRKVHVCLLDTITRRRGAASRMRRRLAASRIWAWGTISSGGWAKPRAATLWPPWLMAATPTMAIRPSAITAWPLNCCATVPMMGAVPIAVRLCAAWAI